MDRSYYAYRYRLDGRDGFLIWYNGDPDGVHLDPHGLVPVFGDVESLSGYSRQQGIVVESGEPGFLDLDRLADWLKDPAPGEVDPPAFNHAWNLFIDVSESTGGDFDADRALTLGIYDKLFYGCNLPAMTPEGEHYEPEWAPCELETMSETLAHGLEIFRRATRANIT